MSAESQSPGATTVEQAIRAERQQMALKITLYGDGGAHNGPAGTESCRRSLGGMGTSTSRWGTSAYSCFGELVWRREACQIGCLSVDLYGKRVSGFDCGDVRFTITQVGPSEIVGERFALDCPACYSDDHNSQLAVRIHLSGVLTDGAVKQIDLRGLADDFTYAEFLASGESLGGAE